MTEYSVSSSTGAGFSSSQTFDGFISAVTIGDLDDDTRDGDGAFALPETDQVAVVFLKSDVRMGT